MAKKIAKDNECPLYVFVSNKAAKYMKENMDGTEWRNRQVQNYSWKLQYLFLKWQNN